MQKIDYEDLLVSLLLYQFADSETIKAILENAGAMARTLEDAAWELATETWIDDATGIYLDRIGEIVNVGRSGRDDETYRNLIRLGIAVNVGGGQPNLIMEVVKAVYGASYVHYVPDYPAKFILYHDGVLGLYFEGGFVLDETENSGEQIGFSDGSLMTYRESDTASVDLVSRIAPAGVLMEITAE